MFRILVQFGSSKFPKHDTRYTFCTYAETTFWTFIDHSRLLLKKIVLAVLCIITVFTISSSSLRHKLVVCQEQEATDETYSSVGKLLQKYNNYSC